MGRSLPVLQLPLFHAFCVIWKTYENGCGLTAATNFVKPKDWCIRCMYSQARHHRIATAMFRLVLPMMRLGWKHKETNTKMCWPWSLTQVTRFNCNCSWLPLQATAARDMTSLRGESLVLEGLHPLSPTDLPAATPRPEGGALARDRSVEKAGQHLDANGCHGENQQHHKSQTIQFSFWLIFGYSKTENWRWSISDHTNITAPLFVSVLDATVFVGSSPCGPRPGRLRCVSACASVPAWLRVRLRTAQSTWRSNPWPNAAWHAGKLLKWIIFWVMNIWPRISFWMFLCCKFVLVFSILS